MAPAASCRRHAHPLDQGAAEHSLEVANASATVSRTLRELQERPSAVDTSKQTAAAAVSEMLETHSMLRSDTTALFERLREANILLQEVLSGAHDNMSEIESTLVTRVADFVAAMNRGRAADRHHQPAGRAAHHQLPEASAQTARRPRPARRPVRQRTAARSPRRSRSSTAATGAPRARSTSGANCSKALRHARRQGGRARPPAHALLRPARSVDDPLDRGIEIKADDLTSA